MVVDGIEHAAQGQDGHIHPGLSQLAFGHGLGLDRAGRRLRGGHHCGGTGPSYGEAGEAGEADGGHELPAGKVCSCGFAAHDDGPLLRAPGAG